MDEKKILKFPTNEERRKTIIDKAIKGIEDEFEVAASDGIVERFDELRKRWDVPVEMIVKKAVHEIRAVDPQFFIKNNLNLNNVTERLLQAYKNSPELGKNYDGNMDKMLSVLSYKFNVFLDHLAFFVTEHFENKELIQEEIDKIKSLLNGTYYEDFFEEE